MSRKPHSEHSFTRLLSRSSAGTALYGCSFGSSIAGCGETEVRAIGAASPFAIKRQQAKARRGTKGVIA